MPRTLAGLLLLILAAPSWAAPPTLEGPASVPANSLVRVRLAGEYDQAIWSVEPEARADVEPSPDGRGMVFTGPAGTYRLEATYIGWESKLFGKIKGTFTIGEAGPDPGPGPSPDPTPPPTPDPPVPPVPPVVAGPLHVVYVSDVDTLDLASGLIRGSATIGPALASLDARWKAYDDTTADPPAQPYLSRARAVGLPALFVVKSDGTVVSGAKAPATEAGIVEMVKALRGGAK